MKEWASDHKKELTIFAVIAIISLLLSLVIPLCVNGRAMGKFVHEDESIFITPWTITIKYVENNTQYKFRSTCWLIGNTIKIERETTDYLILDAIPITIGANGNLFVTRNDVTKEFKRT